MKKLSIKKQQKENKNYFENIKKIDQNYANSQINYRL